MHKYTNSGNREWLKTLTLFELIKEYEEYRLSLQEVSKLDDLGQADANHYAWEEHGWDVYQDIVTALEEFHGIIMKHWRKL
jgi:hypothetical protein